MVHCCNLHSSRAEVRLSCSLTPQIWGGDGAGRLMKNRPTSSGPASGLCQAAGLKWPSVLGSRLLSQLKSKVFKEHTPVHLRDKQGGPGNETEFSQLTDFPRSPLQKMAKNSSLGTQPHNLHLPPPASAPPPLPPPPWLCLKWPWPGSQHSTGPSSANKLQSGWPQAKNELLWLSHKNHLS